MQTWRVIYYIQVHWSNSAWELSVSCSDLSRGRELPQTMPQGQPPAVTTCPQNCVNWVLTQTVSTTETRSPYCLIPQGDCSVTGGTMPSVTCLSCGSHPIGLERGRSTSSVMGSAARWVASWPSQWACSIPTQELELSMGYDCCTYSTQPSQLGHRVLGILYRVKVSWSRQ